VSAYDLGVVYTGQYGDKPNLDEAAEMFRKSVKLNYVPAEYSLGLLIARHPQFGHSPDEGRHWLEAAAQAGYWKANTVLGILSRDGDGMPQDADAALYYFKVAMAQGGADAERLVRGEVNRLTAKMPPDRVAAITSRANAWAQNHPPVFLLMNGGNEPNLASNSPAMSQPSRPAATRRAAALPPPA
jgi:TPR repeat protein